MLVQLCLEPYLVRALEYDKWSNVSKKFNFDNNLRMEGGWAPANPMQRSAGQGVYYNLFYH
jgi:hypothetical protein